MNSSCTMIEMMISVFFMIKLKYVSFMAMHVYECVQRSENGVRNLSFIYYSLPTC